MCMTREPFQPPASPAGTGEIGVPPYFAKRLSFPERVTRWNAEQLAAAVRGGHEALPGAVAVEDESGRMLSLVNMPAEVRACTCAQAPHQSRTPIASKE